MCIVVAFLGAGLLEYNFGDSELVTLLMFFVTAPYCPLGRGSRRPLDIAILGTRGIPANYGGFETFAEELSVRLVRRGHRVCVYGRRHFVNPRLALYRGVEIRVLPCVRTKYLETISHTALSAARALFDSHDIVLICNSANACLCWLPALAGQGSCFESGRH